MLQNKKSFVLYFDAYPLVRMLSPEQKGHLLDAVFGFADKVAKDPECDLDLWLEEYPAMTEDTRMACGFLCAGIQRDTRKWYVQREARSQRRAREREESKETKSSSQSQQGSTDLDGAWKYV